ncbi:B3 domain-containing transcription factor VRN1 [Linum grandiflorum]
MNKPYFFRIMLDFMLQDGRIYIPTEFVERHRDRLTGSRTATLKAVNGQTWEVELVSNGEDGKIWLGNGWGEFSKKQSLQQGDVVVFRLEQDCYFHVMVFDSTTATENINCSSSSHYQVKLEK